VVAGWSLESKLEKDGKLVEENYYSGSALTKGVPGPMLDVYN
jgi:hypothetical protein